MSVGASLKSIPARSLLSASFSFVSFVLVRLSSLSSLHHKREGGGIEVGVAPSYISGIRGEGRSVGGDQDEGTRESAGEKKHKEDETLGSKGEDGTIRGRLRL